jgi:hypothetical protein
LPGYSTAHSGQRRHHYLRAITGLIKCTFPWARCQGVREMWRQRQATPEKEAHCDDRTSGIRQVSRITDVIDRSVMNIVQRAYSGPETVYFLTQTVVLSETKIPYANPFSRRLALSLALLSPFLYRALSHYAQSRRYHCARNTVPDGIVRNKAPTLSRPRLALSQLVSFGYAIESSV